MRISSIRSYNLNDWRYVCYRTNEDYDLPPEIVPINYLGLNSNSDSPVELMTYRLNLFELPRVMNIMSKQSGYSLSKLICIKSSFSITEEVDGMLLDRSGSLIRFYIPNFEYDESGNVVPLNIGEFRIVRNGTPAIYILDETKNLLNPVAVLELSSSETLKEEIYGSNSVAISNDDVIEQENKRIFTILISSDPDIHKICDLAIHKTQLVNEHQGQSALVIDDLRYGTYISKLFSNILINDKRLTCLNGVIIASDFTKYYIGTYTQEDEFNYLITSRTKEFITTSNGDEITYNRR